MQIGEAGYGLVRRSNSGRKAEDRRRGVNLHRPSPLSHLLPPSTWLLLPRSTPTLASLGGSPKRQAIPSDETRSIQRSILPAPNCGISPRPVQPFTAALRQGDAPRGGGRAYSFYSSSGDPKLHSLRHCRLTFFFIVRKQLHSAGHGGGSAYRPCSYSRPTYTAYTGYGT